MLPAAAVTYFNHLCTDGFVVLSLQLSNAQREFDKKEINGRGQGYAARLSALYQEQLKVRGQVIVESVKTMHEKFCLPNDESTTAQLKALAEKAFHIQVDGLRGSYERHLQSFGIVPTADLFAYQGPLTQAWVMNTVCRHLWTLENVPMHKETHTVLTMNFNGPVGAVQTGANAAATVTQSWSGESLDAVVKALTDFNALIKNTPSLDAKIQADIESDVKNALEEMATTTPDMTKVMRWLHGVGASVQAVAAIQPAWEAVKVIIRMLGLPF